MYYKTEININDKGKFLAVAAYRFNSGHIICTHGKTKFDESMDVLAVPKGKLELAFDKKDKFARTILEAMKNDTKRKNQVSLVLKKIRGQKYKFKVVGFDVSYMYSMLSYLNKNTFSKEELYKACLLFVMVRDYYIITERNSTLDVAMAKHIKRTENSKGHVNTNVRIKIMYTLLNKGVLPNKFTKEYKIREMYLYNYEDREKSLFHNVILNAYAIIFITVLSCLEETICTIDDIIGAVSMDPVFCISLLSSISDKTNSYHYQNTEAMLVDYIARRVLDGDDKDTLLAEFEQREWKWKLPDRTRSVQLRRE